MFVFGVYWNLDSSDYIFDCLLTAMAKVPFVSRNASFLFVGDVNAHHSEWLGSSKTNLHERDARDLTSSLGCEMITEPTHIDGGVLDLMLTDVPDGVRVRLGSPIEPLDHSVIFIDVALEQPIPHLVCRQEVHLKNSVDWELVRGDVKSLNRNEIIRSLCPVSSLNEALLRIIRA